MRLNDGRVLVLNKPPAWNRGRAPRCVITIVGAALTSHRLVVGAEASGVPEDSSSKLPDSSSSSPVPRPRFTSTIPGRSMVRVRTMRAGWCPSSQEGH